MTLLTFLILSLATYRITHLIVFDKIFEPIRNIFVKRFVEINKLEQYHIVYRLQGGTVRRFIGKMMNCFWCAGIWVSALVVIGYYAIPTITTIVCLWLSFAAVQSLLETVWAKVVGFPEMEEAPAAGTDNPAGMFRGLAYGIGITAVIAAAIFGSWYFAKIMLGGNQ